MRGVGSYLTILSSSTVSAVLPVPTTSSKAWSSSAKPTKHLPLRPRDDPRLSQNSLHWDEHNHTSAREGCEVQAKAVISGSVGAVRLQYLGKMVPHHEHEFEIRSQVISIARRLD